MASNFFKNLPDTTTPLTASRLNGLLDGDEAMGSVLMQNLTVQNKVQLGTSGISDSNAAGFDHDQYGNWTHKRNTAGDTFSIKNNSGTSTFTVYPETGNVTITGKLTSANDTTLFTGDTNTGPISLSDSAANYDYIDIIYRSSDGANYVGCQRVYSPNNKNIYLETKRYASDKIYIKYIELTISTNQITLSNGYQYYFSTNVSSNITSASANYIYITKIIGHKN